VNKYQREVVRWLRQAEADISGAKDSLKTGHYEWACFQSQQGAEKALKAFLFQQGLRAIITHSLRDLLQECSKYEESFLRLMEDGRFLDTFYIPARYPNGLPGDAPPAEFYTEGDAIKCISSAESILKEAKKYIKG